MNTLSAFIIKLKPSATREIEQNIERDMYLAFKNFTDEEQEEFVMDDENNTMIAFIDIEDKHKLDEVVKSATQHQDDIVTVYEDVTEKFLYKNDFSDYGLKSDLINKFIRKSLSVDDILEKITKLGMSGLTEVDMCILEGR